VKGKPWNPELEKQLKGLIEVKTLLSVIARQLDVSEESVRAQVRRLGLEEVEHKKIICSSSSMVILPKDLSSVEEILGDLHAAVADLKTPGLDKTEVLRLRGIIVGCKVYKEMLVEYLDYRGLEAELEELTKKYAELEKNPPSVSSR